MKSVPIGVAIVVAAILIIGGWIGYQEYARARVQSEARAAVESVDKAQQIARDLQKAHSWEERRQAIIQIFDNLSADEQAEFFLTFRESAESSANQTIPNKASLRVRLEQIAALEKDLRNRRKQR